MSHYHRPQHPADCPRKTTHPQPDQVRQRNHRESRQAGSAEAWPEPPYPRTRLGGTHGVHQVQSPLPRHPPGAGVRQRHLTDLLDLRKPGSQIPQGQAVLLHRLPLQSRRRPQRGTQHRGSGNVHLREAKGRHTGRHTPTAAHAARRVRSSTTRASDWIRSYATSVPYGLIWLSPFPLHRTNSLLTAMRGIANTIFAQT